MKWFLGEIIKWKKTKYSTMGIHGILFFVYGTRNKKTYMYLLILKRNTGRIKLGNKVCYWQSGGGWSGKDMGKNDTSNFLYTYDFCNMLYTFEN